MRVKPQRSQCAALLLAALFFFIIFQVVLRSSRGYELLRTEADAEARYGRLCSPFASGAMDKVTVILKMGAGEVSVQLPAYLDHLGSCETDILLFSDRKDVHKSLDIHDALANLRPEHRRNNPDFDAYDAIQDADGTVQKTHEGWRLDKYKFLPMMEHTYHLRPKSDWYVFLELDTYVNWDNMHRFLARHDADKPYYFGSPVWPRKKPVFAHGGTGFVLSGAALKKLNTHGKKFTAHGEYIPGTHQFGKDMQQECCGDEVLADVLKDSGLTLRGYWPMFNGEKPSTIRFGREQWCEAILTLHHLSLDDFSDLERWESSSRYTQATALTFEELFTYIESYLRGRVEDWTNMSEDIVHPDGTHAAESFETCFGACLKNKKCMQFEHGDGMCRLSYDIRMGHHKKAERGTRWTSGWMMERIEAFKALHSPCDGAHLVHPNP